MLPYFVREVERLSQQEGLYDQEIAEMMGCHRTTITRCREKHNIPRANLSNRRDKKQVCRNPECGKEEWIRRNQYVSKFCSLCKELRRQQILEKKRERERLRVKAVKADDESRR